MLGGVLVACCPDLGHMVILDHDGRCWREEGAYGAPLGLLNSCWCLDRHLPAEAQALGSLALMPSTPASVPSAVRQGTVQHPADTSVQLSTSHQHLLVDPRAPRDVRVSNPKSRAVNPQEPPGLQQQPQTLPPPPPPPQPHKASPTAPSARVGPENEQAPTFRSMSSSAAFWPWTSPRMVSSSSRVPSSRPCPLLGVSPQRTITMRAATLSELYGGPGICGT